MTFLRPLLDRAVCEARKEQLNLFSYSLAVCDTNAPTTSSSSYAWPSDQDAKETPRENGRVNIPGTCFSFPCPGDGVVSFRVTQEGISVRGTP